MGLADREAEGDCDEEEDRVQGAGHLRCRLLTFLGFVNGREEMRHPKDKLRAMLRADLPVKETEGDWSRRRVATWLAALATVAAIYAVLPSTPGAAIKSEDVRRATVAPRLYGTHRCVSASVSGAHLVTGVGECETPTLNRHEVDRLRSISDMAHLFFVNQICFRRMCSTLRLRIHIPLRIGFQGILFMRTHS